MQLNHIYTGNAVEVLRTLPAGRVDFCVTSPPYYGLRNYNVDGQIGLEETPQAYIERLLSVFRQVHRVLKKEGTLWLNMGDSYNGSGKANGCSL
ncbi:MAG: site-specific DNA-methyltransferase [Bacteroidales bacterium]|jgi:site-specific DNA-methyltransferase (adenine-specific)|nr:site-specific DNA-methyltransferase [Bacteroidales bacterium]